MPVEVKPLFRPDVLRPRLNSFVLPSDAVGQLPALQKWAALLASVQAGSLKEDELLPDFLSDIFLRLLGYSRVTDSPGSYSFSREHHVEVDGKFADAVLGRFATDTRR